MAGPSWLVDTLAAIMITLTVYCACRLLASRLWRRPTDCDADITHIAMGVAMTGMLVPRLNPLWDSMWEVIFGIAAAWFACRISQDSRGSGAVGWVKGPRLPHLVHCVAMLYMLLAARVSAGGAGPAPMARVGGFSDAARFPVLAFVLALLVLGYSVRDADGLTAPAAGVRYPASPSADRRLADMPVPSSWAPAESPGMRRAADTGRTYQRDGAPVLAPCIAVCCRITLGITMGYMLIMML